MIDRYLCKAKRTDNGEWVEGYPVKFGGVYWIYTGKINKIAPYTNGYGSTIYPPIRYMVNPETICQYTGKTDIEKKPIFEHDAISFLDAYSTENGYAESWCIGEVLWDDETLSFQVTERLSAESYEVLDDCKVLGNTIDNPELLEGGAE